MVFSDEPNLVKLLLLYFAGMPHDLCIRNMMSLYLACQNYRSLHTVELVSMLETILIW